MKKLMTVILMVFLMTFVGYAIQSKDPLIRLNNKFKSEVKTKVMMLNKKYPQYNKEIIKKLKKYRKHKFYQRGIFRIEREFYEKCDDLEHKFKKIIKEKKEKAEAVKRIKYINDNKIFITGFRNINLGDKVDVSVLKKYKDPYTYIIDVKDKYFENIVLSVTPTSHKIYKIWVMGYIENDEKRTALYHMIKIRYDKEYGAIRCSKLMFDYTVYNDMINNRSLTIQDGNFVSPSSQCIIYSHSKRINNNAFKRWQKEEHRVGIFFTDKNLRKLYFSEKADVIELTADDLKL